MRQPQIQQHPHADGVSQLALDTYRWVEGIPSAQTPRIEPGFELGEMWTVGVGSVGNCVLFFLSLITRKFQAVLVDRDLVEVENITRSAIFSWPDAIARLPKAEAAARWLRETGVECVDPHVVWLHEIPELWSMREQGTPDLLISAANEHDVRSTIEVWSSASAGIRNDWSELASHSVSTCANDRGLLALRVRQRSNANARAVRNRSSSLR